MQRSTIVLLWFYFFILTLRSHQKMQKVDARRDPIQSECRDALLLCCRSICCRENGQQNLICGASKSDLRRGMPVPAAGHGRRARSRILRRVKCCSSWNISTFDAPQNLWRTAKLDLTRRKTQASTRSGSKCIFWCERRVKPYVLL